MPDFGFHHWLDAQLRNVSLPADLLARLSASGPEPSAADEQLDAELRNVTVPPDLEARLRRIARPRYMPAPLWQRFALAASVFVVLGLGVAGYVALITGEFGQPMPSVATRPPEAVPQPAEPAHAVKQPSQQAMVAVSQEKRGVGARREDMSRAAKPDRQTPVHPRAEDVGFPTIDRLVALGSSIRRAVDARLREQATLGAGLGLERMPDFEVIETLAPRSGVSPPRVKGYDLLFQLKHSEHPFVSPLAHPDLVATAMPMTMSTASYDIARRAVRAGRTPATDEIRVEDFVAAQNYLFPAAPAGGLALHTAGCPSPLGAKDLHLIQFSVQGATWRSRPHPAARLVVGLELSWQMRAAAHWEAIERALSGLVHFMTDADRVTLLGISEQPRILAQDITSRELQTLMASGKLPQPSGSADFEQAFDAAGHAARAPSGGRQSRVVFLASSFSRLAAIDPDAAKRSMISASGKATAWQVVCLSDPPDTQHESWMTAAGATLTVADSSANVQAALVESLTGRTSMIAANVALKLSFNPRVVTGYRLLGHEAVALTGTSVDPVTIDLAADQSVTGIYEMWIKPKSDDVVAAAELTWKDPNAGQSRRVVRAVRQSQLAASFSQAPPWLQQGIVAAKAAEAMRGSYYAKSANPLTAVLELADQVDPQVRQLREFQELVTLVQQAGRVR